MFTVGGECLRLLYCHVWLDSSHRRAPIDIYFSQQSIRNFVSSKLPLHQCTKQKPSIFIFVSHWHSVKKHSISLTIDIIVLLPATGIPQKLLVGNYHATRLWFEPQSCMLKSYSCATISARNFISEWLLLAKKWQQGMAIRTGQLGQDNHDRRARTGQPGQDSQDRTARTGQPG
jgi:hypothetical protein